MQLILLDDVDGLGHTGDTIKVKPGYARNFLLPRGLAVEASARNANQLKHRQQMVAARVETKKLEAEGLAGRVRKAEIDIGMLVGEGDKMYGSVTNRDIEEALREQGIRISRKKISLAEPIRSLGEHTVMVKIHPEVVAELKVQVSRRDGTIPVAEEEEEEEFEIFYAGDPDLDLRDI